MLCGIGANSFFNKRYVAKTKAANGHPLPPEERLYLCCLGAVFFPVGLLILAFTADKDIHWIAPVIAGAPFGFGLVAVFLSQTASLYPVPPLSVANPVLTFF